MNLKQKALSLLAVFFALEILYLGILALMVEQARCQNEEMREARQVCQRIGLLVNGTHDLHIDTLDEIFVHHNKFSDIRTSCDNLQKYCDGLRHAVGDDPKYANAIEQITVACDRLPVVCKDIHSARQKSDKYEMVGSMLTVDDLSYNLFNTLMEMDNSYKQVEARAEEGLRAQAGMLLGLTLILGFAFNVAVGLLLYNAFISGMTRRLNAVTEDMQNLASGQPVTERELGEDEIDLLALELKKMAATLQDFRSKEKILLDQVARNVGKREQSLEAIRRSQEEFRSIVESMPIGVITCNKSFAVTATNPAACEMLNYPAPELLSKNLSVLFTGDEPGPETESQLLTIVSMAEEKPMELNLFKIDKATLPVELTSRNFPQTSKHLIAFRDVSARVEIETMKKDFVSMVSHDLRSPLTALFGTLDMIVEGRHGSKTEAVTPEQSLSAAQTIVARLVNLINDFLDLEKFEAGMGVLETADVEITELANRAVETLSAPHPVDVIVEKSATVKLDKQRMAFALANFLSAAIENSDKDGAIKLTFQASGNSVAITIQGQCCKFPSIIKEACFSRYTFLPLASDHAFSSELGLALSRKVVEAHGGEVRFEKFDESFEQIRINLQSRASA